MPHNDVYNAIFLTVGVFIGLFIRPKPSKPVVRIELPPGHSISMRPIDSTIDATFVNGPKES